MEERPNYYAIIPADVRYDEELRANEKLLYGEITSLTQKNGKCWASNNYFAKLYKATPQAISKWIIHLKEKKYIDIDYEYEGKVIKRRVIKVSTNIDRVSTNDLEGYQQMIKENNTSIKEEEDKEIYKEKNIFDLVESNLNRILSPIEIETIKKWDYDYEIIELAIKEAMLRNAKTIKYIDRMIFNWKQNNINTLEDATKYLEEFSNNKPKKEKKEDKIENYYKCYD